MVRNMTEGDPGKIMLKFSLPMIGSIIFQQLYNITDSVVAGKFIGDEALAAVGVSYPVTAIFTAFAVGLNIGCSVVISQLFGAKRMKDMKTAVSTSVITSFILSFILTVLGIILCHPLLNLLNTPINIFSSSSSYLYIYTAGLIFVFLYNICAGTFTALGDSITPFCFLVCSSIGNIILDIVFVTKFKLGVNGVAWATFICQGIAAVLACSVLIFKMIHIKTEQYKKFSFSMLGKISRIAVPSILQQSFISIGNLIVQGVVNNYSTAVIAGYAACVKLNTFAITLFTSVSNSVSSFTAQNIGAGKFDRVEKGFKAGLKISLCSVIPFTLFYIFAGKYAMMLFVNANNTDTIAEGCKFLLYVSPFYIVAAYKLICDGILHGAAAVKYFTTATFTDLILRSLFAILLPKIFPAMGASAIWIAWPIGWIISTFMSTFFYKSGLWKKKLI